MKMTVTALLETPPVGKEWRKRIAAIELMSLSILINFPSQEIRLKGLARGLAI